MTPFERDECRAVDALLAHADRLTSWDGISTRSSAAEQHGDSGLELAERHGVSPLRVAAYRSLARSRGLDLEQVLRAAFRGELREVVVLPEVRR